MNYLQETGFANMAEHYEWELEQKAAKQRRQDLMYMAIAEVFAEESHSRRSKVGCVLVKGENIISSGWNGTPAGFDNECEDEYLCASRRMELITKPEVLHAELNALAKIACSTQSSEGATIYVTLSPCGDCAKLIIQSKVKRVVYKEPYRDPAGVELLEKAGIEVVKL